MSIFGHRDENTIHDAADFTYEFVRAQHHMKEASRKLLKIAQGSPNSGERRRYDRTYKQMVKIIKTWNSLEHSREVELRHPVTGLLAGETELVIKHGVTVAGQSNCVINTGSSPSLLGVPDGYIWLDGNGAEHAAPELPEKHYGAHAYYLGEKKT